MVAWNIQIATTTISIILWIAAVLHQTFILATIIHLKITIIMPNLLELDLLVKDKDLLMFLAMELKFKLWLAKTLALISNIQTIIIKWQASLVLFQVGKVITKRHL